MKKLLHLTALVTCLVLGSLTPLGHGQEPAAHNEQAPIMLTMRNGGILFGAIENHSPDELQFHRLDTGGHLSLPWGLLDPALERKLKLSYGYIEVDFIEELVSADRLTLDDGTELIGLILPSVEAGTIMVKNSSAVIALPATRVVGQSVMVQVPSSEIYSRDERYQIKLKEFTRELASAVPREAAQAHLDLGIWCEGIRDFGRALEHYQSVVLSDPSWPLPALQPSLERAMAKAAVQEQVDYLEDIERLTRRGNYAKSLDMLASFEVLFPETPLMEDWNIQRDRTLRAQLKTLRREVAKRWHAAASRQARAASRFETYAEVKAFLDERMGEEILTLVTADMLDISPIITREEVSLLFSEREGGRWRKASFGNGTWLLGEKRARAGIEKEAEAGPKGEQEAKRDDIAEKVKRYMENIEAVRSSSNAGDGMTPADYWPTFNANARTNWILAYYAEFSGVMQMRRALFGNCRECGGKGVREVVNLGSALSGAAGGQRMEPCITCQGVGVIRRVAYR